MTPRQLFKFAFIHAAIQRGYTTPTAINTAIEKKAFGVDDVLGVLKGGAGLALGTAAAAPIVAGAALGGTGGYVMNQLDDYNEDDARNDELVDEYRRQAQLARRRALLRQHSQARHQSGRVFM